MPTEMKFKDMEIVRQGNQIILPAGMTYKEAIEWCQRKETEDEREVNVHHELHYSPLDGAVAFHKALAEIYGWTELVPTPSFWGPQPPTMVGVPISTTERMQVPWGRVKVPNVDGWLATGMAVEPTPRFVISGKVKQKNLPDVMKIVKKTEEVLKTASIYKAKAIKINFEWLRTGANFDASEHCPKFIDLSGVDENDLIFSSAVDNALNIGLFGPIKYNQACRQYKVPLKRGLLFYGPYGCGKTLAANVTALKSVKADWTFVYLDNVLDLKKGLQFAAQYSPSILFAEDVDRVIKGERSISMDEILNILDGVDTKGKEIITVFTTNHVEDINPALLRMGRLDTLVHIEPPDADAAVRLVKLYGRGLLQEGVNYTRIGVVLQGRIPAYIREVVERAKIAAICRMEGGDIVGKVLEEDLLSASQAMEPHAALLEPKLLPVNGGPELLVRVPDSNMPEARKLLERLKVVAVTNNNDDYD